MTARLTLNNFIERAKVAHGDRYDYSDVNYINTNTKIDIICTFHGIFTQMPLHHLHGAGCTKCYNEKRKELNKWTVDTIKNEALKYTNRSSFKKLSNGAYVAAKRLNILDDVCSHIKLMRIYWTDDMLKSEALKYNTLTDFYRGNCSAYATACNRNIIYDISTHMVRGKSGYNMDKGGWLYYIRFDYLDVSLYKIGITNINTKNRIVSMNVNKNWISTIIQETYYSDGKTAFIKEQLLHLKFSEHKYFGDNIMKRGNSELFIKDVLGLDNFI